MKENITQNINNTTIRYTDEDEIDLKELWQTILKGKKLIIQVTTVMVILAIIYAMSKPNEYTSKTILVVQESSKASVGGGLSMLAGIAGIDMSSDGGISPADGYQTLLNDYSFMKDFVINRELHKRFLSPDLADNYKFALGFSGIYTIFNFSSNPEFDDMLPMEKEIAIYEIIQEVKDIISISTDKKTNLLTISATFYDRELAKDLVDYFLKDASLYLKENEMLENDQKIKYYEEALQKTQDIALKSKLAELGSALIQKKVLANSNEFYNVKQLTKPEIAFEKAKAGPKRALIVVVSAVTGFILSIFFVFLLEFIRKDESQTEQS